jgi:hypothetical protein
MDGPVIEPGPMWRDDVGLTVLAIFNVQGGGIKWALILKRPPEVLGRRGPPGVKCDPTMKMFKIHAGFSPFIIKLKYKFDKRTTV